VDEACYECSMRSELHLFPLPRNNPKMGKGASPEQNHAQNEAKSGDPTQEGDASSVSGQQVASLKKPESRAQNQGGDARGARDAILGTNFSHTAFTCKLCDLKTSSRFDYRWHVEKLHGIEWDMTDQPPSRPPIVDPNPNPNLADQGASLCSDNNRSLKLEIPRCNPFVKWAGGKTQLLKELDTMIPTKFNRYFEPFLGGGAMFFYLVSSRNLRFSAHLSDINTNLISCYQTLKYDANGLAEVLARYEKEYRGSSNKRRYYNSLRDDYNHLQDQSSLEKAARFILLNKTCFNGLYRVNEEGKFNTPWGKRDNPTMCDNYNLRKICVALNYCDASITTNCYEAALSDVTKDDFVYLDPPYYPISETANFTDYSASGFSKKDHITLSKVFAELDNRGSKVLLSNSNTDFIKQLYSDFTIREVNASRAINSDASKRGRNKNTELIISNYLPVMVESASIGQVY
jgi:DNA adenine methylase